MAQVIIQRAPAKSDVYCYDDVTDAGEVNDTLHEIVKAFKMTKNIWVISGTHGTDIGTVDPLCREPDFKREDINSANVTCKNIHIFDYHLLGRNTWAKIRDKPGGKNVIVLAFCYSSLWFTNLSPAGNNGKL